MTEGKDNTFFGSPSNAQFTQLMKYEPIPTPFIPGKIDSDAYTAYIFSLKALRAYSYISDSLERVYQTNVKFRDLNDLNHKEGEKLHSFTTPNGHVKVKVGDDKTTFASGRVEDFMVPINFKKDIPDLTQMNLGSIALSKSGDHMVFPYFDGMVNSDKEIAVSIFQKYFLKSLGKDIQSAANLWEIIRRGFRKLAFCAAGRALSHAYLGIQMSEAAQCGITFIVTSNRYRGYILSGAFAVVIRGTIKMPGNFDEAQKVLVTMGSTVQKKVELQALIRTPVNMDGNVINDIQQDDLKDSRSFFKYMQKANLGSYDIDLKKKIIEKVDSIEWEMKYAEMKEQNILDALAYIDTGNDSAIEKYSAYVQNGFFWTDSRVNYAFGIFGSFAPTILYEGKEVKVLVVPSLGKSDTLRTKNSDGKYPLPYLPIYKTGVENAVGKWTQFFTTGKIILNPPTKGKGGKEIVGAFANPKREFGKIQGTIFEDEIYPLIRKIVTDRRDVKGKGKRSRIGGDSEDMDTDAVKKYKRSAEVFEMIVE